MQVKELKEMKAIIILPTENPTVIIKIIMYFI